MSGEIVHAPSRRGLRTRGALFTAKPHTRAKPSGTVALRTQANAGRQRWRDLQPSVTSIAREERKKTSQGLNWHTSHKSGRWVRRSEAHWQSFDPLPAEDAPSPPACLICLCVSFWPGWALCQGLGWRFLREIAGRVRTAQARPKRRLGGSRTTIDPNTCPKHALGPMSLEGS